MALNGSTSGSGERRHLLDNIKKTIDIGSNGSTAALAQGGSILQLSTYHPKHGIIIASPFEQFKGDFYNSQHVRDYRRKPLDSISNKIPGFGLRFDGDVGDQCKGQLEGYKVKFERFDRTTIEFQPQKDVSVTVTVQVLGKGQVVQTATLKSQSSKPITVPFNLDLSISVNRASYGQLTEAGPVPLPESKNDLSLNGSSDVFSIVNEHLGAHLEGRLYIKGKAARFDTVQPQTQLGCPIRENFSQNVQLQPREEVIVVARLQLWPEASPPFKSTFEELPKLGSCPVWRHQETVDTLIIRRNIDYILGCLAVPLAGSSTETDNTKSICLIADHVALPLGWNRDNYWQLYFLRIARQNLKILMEDGMQDYQHAMDDLFKGHLNWVFRKAQRPEGHWHRSYLVTGRFKDPAKFQLDQQCYPLMELCDFYDLYGKEQKDFVVSILETGVPESILDLLEERRNKTCGLILTEETPGDDAVEKPFHFSSNLLVWHTLTRMASLLESLNPGKERPDLAKQLVQRAAILHADILKHFVTSLPTKKTVFAYETDGKGDHKFYYDANDIPTLFLPEWGFIGDEGDASKKISQKQAHHDCTTTNGIAPNELHEIWHNTMRYGTSSDNKGGYFNGGIFAGLGSVHTKHPWPLGYYHEWMYAKHGDRSKTAEQEAWSRISGAMAFDGTFSEAVNAVDARCESKAWFSWPGSMIASELVNERRRAWGASGQR